jgi:hypothetical protein
MLGCLKLLHECGDGGIVHCLTFEHHAVTIVAQRGEPCLIGDDCAQFVQDFHRAGLLGIEVLDYIELSLQLLFLLFELFYLTGFSSELLDLYLRG